MKNFFIVTITIICTTFSVFALPNYTFNNDSTNQTKTVKKDNMLYIELLGNGGFISINYERFITDKISFRLGMGTDPPPYSVAAFYPIIINYTFESPFEIGLGVTFFNFKGGYLRDEIFADKTSGAIITSVIGFKKNYNWFLLKASFTPFFNPVNSKILLYGGISFGIAF